MKISEELKALESELSESHAHESKKDDAEKIVQSCFEENKGDAPNEAEITEHFLTKIYLHIDQNLPNNLKDESNTTNELIESFFELTDKALFSKSRMLSNEANSYLSDAYGISKRVNSPFITAQYEFAKSLEDAALKTKLKVDRCYELVNTTLEKNIPEGISLIGTGLFLAEQINDQKRRIDFLSKCQYILYEFENYPNVAMSLGKSLICQTIDYEMLNAWSHFHNGNIWIDFKNFLSAKEEFEHAMDLAFKVKSHYAIMTLYERLALTYRRLAKPNLAGQFYDMSLSIGETEDIKPNLVLKNKVRCYIGLGNLQLDLARQCSDTEKDNYCQKAEIQYKKALEIANQVNYIANKAVAYSCLGSLYRTRFDDQNQDAKIYHKLAYDLNTNVLKLDATSERVKKDKAYL